jgi:PRTRC genetic system protein B
MPKNDSLINCYIDPRVIANNDNNVAFFTKRQEQKLWFSVLENESFTIKCPSLIFLYNKRARQLYVVMQMGNSRPTLETKVFLVPFMNIHSSTNVCTGTMTLPKRWDNNSIDLIVDQFFNSRFTHPNYSTSVMHYDDSEANISFIKKYAQSKKHFKKSDLIEFGTLSKFLGIAK